MNWERFRNMQLPLDYWDTLSIRFAQRLVKNTYDWIRCDWNLQPRPYLFNQLPILRQMHQDLEEIVTKHGYKGEGHATTQD